MEAASLPRGTRISSTRFATPDLRLIGLRTSGANEQKKAPGTPGLSNMAATVANEALVREHERIVGKLNGRHFLGAYHHLERFNPLPIEGETGVLAGVAAHTPKPVAIKARQRQTG